MDRGWYYRKRKSGFAYRYELFSPLRELAMLARSHSVWFYLCFCRPSATMSLSLSLSLSLSPLPSQFRLRLRLPPECFASVASLTLLTSMARHTSTSTSTLCILPICLADSCGGMFKAKFETRPVAIVFAMARMPSTRPF
ncbi:uncharacterized protein P174DRAFT_41382 [Aspergillus novofumigatus IBT 16806]|uniref:Uncharacterized protein n=1 Tax=Aspergillus novofumigatus (strain IBT 16806) TaxID=1392255 RepID=A0A2I1CNI9_ASPN1|nr:uncharacterized protein P174DRAFT_41382 [Aspergillus novofumigatus IBT 16806]PKX99191.1 hypothetical protein P174DRAFT_41382 [Aspergillus novofumigatus IBT 16806]